nr:MULTISPECIES: YjfI family protein [unclassified Pseudomonas]
MHDRGPVEKEGDMSMPQTWNAQALCQALAGTELFSAGDASVELLDGADASLHVTMHEYGDLPLFVALHGGQILVEALLWPQSAVSDVAAFNEEVLLSRQLFPLSSIGLDAQADGERCYSMFGALSATSLLSNVLYEIETLASNVIRATEAYEGYLKAQA